MPYKDKEKQKAYKEANKARFSAYQKAWYEANKEKEAANNKAWRESNKDKIKAYREANKDKISAQRKAYREANKEKQKAYRKYWLEANSLSLSDSYVVKLLTHNSDLTASDINQHPELIELKREQLKLHRATQK